MSIQGMSQGLSFSNMSYYISERIPGIVPCTTPPLYAQSNSGSYNVTFDMGSASGCAILVAEVGITRTDDPTQATADQPIGDKTRWEYNGVYGSEYSACQMGTPRVAANANNHYLPPTDLFVMKGMGYMRGFIGAPYKDSGGNIVSGNTPVSTVVGTKLTTTSIPTANEASTGSGMSNGAKYKAFNNSNASNFGGTPTGQTAPVLAYGMFSGNDVYTGASVYNYNSITNVYDVSLLKDFAGPYTGHLETETNDPNCNKAYPGSSAVTLNDDLYSTRQAMMVVPIANGGLVNIRSEQFVEGTWASIKVFCPIALPKWGLANNRVGISHVYSDADLDAALLMNGGTSVVNGATSNSTSVITVVTQINSGGDLPTVGQLVTDSLANIPQGTVVTAVTADAATYTLTSGGSGYTNGAQTNVGISASTGAGTGATVNYTGVGNEITNPTLGNSGGSGYAVGEVLTVAGGSNGFITVASIGSSGAVVTLSQSASIANGDTLTYHIHPLRKKFQNYANQSNVALDPDPALNLQADRYAYFALLGGILKWKPYDTSAQALAHNFGNPTSGSFKSAANKTAYHVPSQNSIYRSQGYSQWKDTTGGSPVNNHGSHVLGNHAGSPLKGNRMTSGGTTANEDYFHGVPNVHDWVFSRSNGSVRSRLPSRGILDRTRKSNNNSSSLGGWYALRITGYFDGANPTVASTHKFAVQVGSLDHTRGIADIDVDSVANQVPRDGVIRTMLAN